MSNHVKLLKIASLFTEAELRHLPISTLRAVVILMHGNEAVRQPDLVAEVLRAQAIYLSEIARGAIEMEVDTEGMTADAIFQAASTAARGALIEWGVPVNQATEIARQAAQLLAQP